MTHKHDLDGRAIQIYASLFQDLYIIRIFVKARKNIRNIIKLETTETGVPGSGYSRDHKV